MPCELAEQLVRHGLRKEAALKRVYAVEITPAMFEAEVQRTNATTRAPDVLVQLKAALGMNRNGSARRRPNPSWSNACCSSALRMIMRSTRKYGAEWPKKESGQSKAQP